MALRRARNPMPADVKRALTGEGLMASYRARPAYQQNDWLGWIAAAKRDATRKRRMDEMLAELRAGEGYMGMPWRPPAKAVAKGTKKRKPAAAARLWRKGRGKLGALDPLLGTWVADAQTPRGKVRVTRALERDLGGKFVRLRATWDLGGGAYEELAVLGPGDRGVLAFWSFTSDGKRSYGELADATDVHPEAVAFEADMDAGRARMVYWPDPSGGMRWAVESRTARGWTRFVEHHYRRAG